MNPLTLELIGVAIRYFATAIGGYLVAQHVLTADQADHLTADLVKHALLAAPVVIPIVWGVVRTIRSRFSLVTALSLKPGASEKDVNAIAKFTSFRETVETAARGEVK